MYLFHFFFLLITFSYCVENNTSSEIKNYVSLNSIEKMESLDFTNNLSADQRKALFQQELKKLGASPAQIKAALTVFNGNECLYDNCALAVQKLILKEASYTNFSKLIIAKINPKEALNIKKDHLPIPKDLQTLYEKNLTNPDLYELSRNHYDLYLKFINRGLQSDGTINPEFAIPEMATIFEKLEKEFLLLKKAVAINPDGVKDFIKTFGYTEPIPIRNISRTLTNTINSVSTLYDPILSKIKTEGWDGLK